MTKKTNYIPISSNDLDHNYPNIFKHSTEKGKLNVVLFREGGSFDVNKIEQAILKCDVEQENVFIHTFASKHTKQGIKAFLRNKRGFLICQEELFCGMEAKPLKPQ